MQKVVKEDKLPLMTIDEIKYNGNNAIVYVDKGDIYRLIAIGINTPEKYYSVFAFININSVDIVTYYKSETLATSVKEALDDNKEVMYLDRIEYRELIGYIMIKLISYDTIRDGGTIHLVFSTEYDKAIHVYVDCRIDTDSRGEWYTDYPDKPTAEKYGLITKMTLMTRINTYIDVLRDIVDLKRYDESKEMDRLLHILEKCIKQF